jgi:hypothetical protein
VENPYQSPHDGPAAPHAKVGSGGMGGQIRVVAILLMVQGGIEIFSAVLFFVLGGVMSSVFAGMAAAPGKQGPPPAVIGWIMAAVYLVWGAVVLLGAVLKITAGWRNFSFRGRVFGIVALLSCVATSLPSIYGAPTGIALFIYGLIVYLNGQSARWFELGARGATPEQIQTTW